MGQAKKDAKKALDGAGIKNKKKWLFIDKYVSANHQPLPYVVIPFFPYFTIPEDFEYMYNVWSLGNVLLWSLSNTTSKFEIPETLIPCKTKSFYLKGVYEIRYAALPTTLF